MAIMIVLVQTNNGWSWESFDWRLYSFVDSMDYLYVIPYRMKFIKTNTKDRILNIPLNYGMFLNICDSLIYNISEAVMFTIENITSPKAIYRAITIDASFNFLALDLWTKFDHIPIMADNIYTNTTIKIIMLTF